MRGCDTPLFFTAKANYLFVSALLGLRSHWSMPNTPLAFGQGRGSGRAAWIAHPVEPPHPPHTGKIGPHSHFKTMPYLYELAKPWMNPDFSRVNTVQYFMVTFG